MEKNSKYILLLIIIGILVYLPSLFNDFVWDDEEQVVNNVAIQSIGNIPYLFTQSTFNTGGSAGMSGMYYKPVMPLFFTLIHQFSGLNAWGFHLVQLLVHLINSYLFFLVLKKFVKPTWAGIASLLFLVHPANVESVAYISGLQDVLFMLFGLLAFWLVLKNKIITQKKWLFVFMLLLLSLFSKETGVLFLLLIPGYLFLYRKHELKNFFLLLSLLLSVYGIMRFGVANIQSNSQEVFPIMLASFEERLITIPKIMFNYIRLMVFPNNLAISQNWVVTQMSFNEFIMPLIVSTVFFLGLLTLCIVKRSKKLWFFSFLLVIGLGMHSQLVALDMTMSERWLYFPLFAFLAILVVLINRLNENNRLVWAAFLVLYLAFSARTFVRVLNWRNGITLFTHDYKQVKNFEFENNLGVYLFREGKYKEAHSHYLRSVDLQPNWWTNWNNLGVTYQMQGQYNKAAQAYLKAIEKGSYYLGYVNYAGLLVKLNKLEKAKDFLENQALPRFPYNENLENTYNYVMNKIVTN